MTAPMVDYKIHWLKMMSVPESRAVVGRHDGINGRDSFSYQAATWDKPRRVVAKVEWHPGELYPRVGFIVTRLIYPFTQTQ